MKWKFIGIYLSKYFLFNMTNLARLRCQMNSDWKLIRSSGNWCITPRALQMCCTDTKPVILLAIFLFSEISKFNHVQFIGISFNVDLEIVQNMHPESSVPFWFSWKTEIIVRFVDTFLFLSSVVVGHKTREFMHNKKFSISCSPLLYH